MKLRNVLFFSIALILGLSLTVAAGVLSKPYTYQGSPVSPPVKAADFRLTDQNGHPFRLSDQKGKTLLIFFGYTHCTDVCPVTMAKFKEIKTQLGDQASKVEFIFITVDPARDQPGVLKQYLAKYDPSFIGLTGSLPDLQTVWKNFGVAVSNQSPDSSGNYEVNHGTYIYAVDGQGYWRLLYSYDTGIAPVVSDVLHLNKEYGG